MKDKLQKLKEVIQKANPEIMELKFGCEVIVNDKLAEIVGLRTHFGDEGDYEFEMFMFDKDITAGKIHWMQAKSGIEYDEDLKEIGNVKIKILGHPIRLADVLLAIDKTDITKCQKYKNERWTMPEFAGHVVLTIVVMYKLEDDNLDNQSEETINFLCDLLVINS